MGSNWVMLLDADAVIVDHSVQFDTVVEGVTTKQRDAEVILSSCKQCTKHNLESNELLSINTGVMLGHNSRWSKSWINEVYMTLFEPSLLQHSPEEGTALPGNTMPFHENWGVYIWIVMHQNKSYQNRVALVDHSVFNAQPHEAQLPTGGWDSYIVHLAGFEFWHPEVENKYKLL